MPIGALHATALGGAIHTLLHPRLGHVAGRAFFRGGAAPLPFTGGGDAARIGAENALLSRWARRGEPLRAHLPQLAEEACSNRTPLCGALLAHWQVRHGRTPGWRRAVASALRPRAVFGPPLSRETLHELALLLPGSGPLGPVPYARAARATRLYRLPYQHAFPFARDRLRAFWQACQDPPAAATLCRRGGEAAERMLAGAADPDGETPR